MSTTVFQPFETVEDLGAAAADRLVGEIVAAAGGAPYLLGCPGGRTPRPVYRALARRCAEESVDCSHVVIVMMDDYVENGSDPPRMVDKDAAHSCRRFAEHDIRRVINSGLVERHRIAPGSVWFPDPADPGRFDRRLADAGGIDLFLVASGASDGHVAFRGPGSELDTRSDVVELATTTRADNTVTFPSLASPDMVPTHGVSVGLGTIRDLSKAVLMMLHGADKETSLTRLRDSERFEPDWPATFVHECRRAEVWYDAAADQHRRTS